MTVQENKAALRRFFDEGFNAHDVDAFADYFAPNAVNHALPPGLPPGIEGIKMYAAGFFNAFSDITVSIEDLVAEGDRLAVRWQAEGTHDGELMGIPATGRQVSFGGTAIDRFENGRSVEHWELFDQVGLMQQLGVIPE